MVADVPDQSHEDIRPPEPREKTTHSHSSGYVSTTFLPVPATTGPEPSSLSGPDLPSLTDAELVLAACGGSADAWETLVDRHLSLVNGIARTYRLSRQDREDAVQTVWLTLNQHLTRLHSPHQLSAWLRRTTQTACNRQRAHRQRFLPVDPRDLTEVAQHQDGPEHHYLVKEAHTELHRAIDGLTDPADRRVAQHYLDDSPGAAPISHRTTPSERRRLIRQLRRSLKETRGADENAEENSESTERRA